MHAGSDGSDMTVAAVAHRFARWTRGHSNSLGERLAARFSGRRRLDPIRSAAAHSISHLVDSVRHRDSTSTRTRRQRPGRENRNSSQPAGKQQQPQQAETQRQPRAAAADDLKRAAAAASKRTPAAPLHSAAADDPAPCHTDATTMARGDDMQSTDFAGDASPPLDRWLPLLQISFPSPPPSSAPSP